MDWRRSKGQELDRLETAPPGVQERCRRKVLPAGVLSWLDQAWSWWLACSRWTVDPSSALGYVARASRLALNALQDHPFGFGMGPDLGDDLTAIPGGDLTAPGMGAIDLI